MRTPRILTAFAMLLASAIPAAADAPKGPKAPTARDVAAAVQSFYEQVSGVEAAFFQTYYHRLYDRYDRSKGKVAFVKPGKMRWDYAQPNGKIIVSDGAKLLVFEPGGAGEVPQLFEREMKAESLPQAFSFLTGTGKLEDSFTFRLLDAAKQGYADGYVLELRPKEPSPQYDRILFYVLKHEGAPSGVVRRVLIVDAAGNRNRFDFSNLAWNPKVTDARFKFAPPAGTRRISN
ncbi:MAG: outer membrane lipoprotein carrier protein LolA [Myxococcales bacterium]|nr:outer membrane lipoprotein carrier protein LolA [Myxococcales bacterium]